MFRPTEIIFVPTTQCNLHCPHCYVKRTAAEYDVKHALNFIDDCAENGIERIGFSGGEPFLNLEFACKVCEKTVEKDLLFGRIMTNAVWWKNENDLMDKLNLLFDSGFDGKITVSLDKFHNQDIEKVKRFADVARQIGQYEDLINFTAVRDGDDEITRNMLSHFTPFHVDWIDYVPQDFDDPQFWQSEKWFRDDFCKGPGNVFYVHNDGNIAGCCGYANEEKELILGNIAKDNYESLMRKAKESPIMNIAYDGGFENEIRKLENEGKIFGKTDNHCLFCRKLIEIKRKTL